MPIQCAPFLHRDPVSLMLTLAILMQDGGYHVPFAHKSLAAGLELGGYASTMHERVSIQRVAPASDGGARLSGVLSRYACHTTWVRVPVSCITQSLTRTLPLSAVGPWHQHKHRACLRFDVQQVLRTQSSRTMAL